MAEAMAWIGSPHSAARLVNSLTGYCFPSGDVTFPFAYLSPLAGILSAMWKHKPVTGVWSAVAPASIALPTRYVIREAQVTPPLGVHRGVSTERRNYLVERQAKVCLGCDLFGNSGQSLSQVWRAEMDQYLAIWQPFEGGLSELSKHLGAQAHTLHAHGKTNPA